MAILLGNVFLFLATIIYVFLLAAAYGEKPQAEKGVTRYKQTVPRLTLFFLACMALAIFVMGKTGGLDWIKVSQPLPWIIAAIGLLATVWVIFRSALFRVESLVPLSVRYLTGIAPALFPAVLLLACAVLLNAPIRDTLPMVCYALPLILVVGISLVAGIMSIFDGRQAAEPALVLSPQEAREHLAHLSEINAANAKTPAGVISLLKFTDDGYHTTLREKALAKIRSNAAWPQILADGLKTEAALQVFIFLASNEVENKAHFAEPVREGIGQLAAWIRRSIRNASQPSHFHAAQFSWEIDRMLATVEHFKDSGTDYLPALQDVRNALEEPSNPPELRKRMAFNAATSLDWWIRQYAKK